MGRAAAHLCQDPPSFPQELGHAGGAWSAAVPSWDRDRDRGGLVGLPCLFELTAPIYAHHRFWGAKRSSRDPGGDEVCPAECSSSCSSLSHHPQASPGEGDSPTSTPAAFARYPRKSQALLLVRVCYCRSDRRAAQPQPGDGSFLPCSRGGALGSHLGSGRAGGVVAAPQGQGPAWGWGLRARQELPPLPWV